MKPLLDRLANKTKTVESGCVEWIGAVNNNGYGQIRKGRAADGKILVHRAAYIAAHGEIPKGFDVMHSCDNRRCVNPKHLSVGTRQDNVNDMKAKGRAYWQRSIPWQKLTAQDAIRICALRNQGKTQQAIADEYKVSRPLISMLLGGRLLYGKVGTQNCKQYPDH